MVKQCVRWKSIKDGGLVDISLPLALEDHYRGTLLPRVFAMPQKTPITFARAIKLTNKIQKKAFFDGQLGIEPGQNGWYTINFIEWISSLGFHIEITGDEFESFAMSDKIS